LCATFISDADYIAWKGSNSFNVYICIIRSSVLSYCELTSAQSLTAVL